LIDELELRGEPFVERRQVGGKRRATRQRLQRGAIGQVRRIREGITSQPADGIYGKSEIRLDELRQIHRIAGIQRAGKRIEDVQQALCRQQQHVQVERGTGDSLRERQDSKLFSRQRHPSTPALTQSVVALPSAR
jgi:hypothetical protein